MPIRGQDLREGRMPSLRLSEIEELTTEFEDFSEIERRRKKRKERKMGAIRGKSNIKEDDSGV